MSVEVVWTFIAGSSASYLPRLSESDALLTLTQLNADTHTPWMLNRHLIIGSLENFISPMFIY